jgi:hypothetical protein
MMPMDSPTSIATNVQVSFADVLVPLGTRYSFQKSKMVASIMDNEMPTQK